MRIWLPPSCTVAPGATVWVKRGGTRPETAHLRARKCAGIPGRRRDGRPPRRPRFYASCSGRLCTLARAQVCGDSTTEEGPDSLCGALASTPVVPGRLCTLARAQVCRYGRNNSIQENRLSLSLRSICTILNSSSLVLSHLAPRRRRVRPPAPFCVSSHGHG